MIADRRPRVRCKIRELLFVEQAELPPGVVTVTSTVPATCAGAVTVIEVSEVAVNDVATVPSKLIAVTPSRLVPVIVTVVPPVRVPLPGLTLVTTGGG